eukprot:COSAG05_NODE_18663_length_305_cov_0.543689_2_plen_22_part_01
MAERARVAEIGRPVRLQTILPW